jgi:hypothetical protein
MCLGDTNMENWCFVSLQSVITGASELMAQADWQVTAQAYTSSFLTQVDYTSGHIYLNVLGLSGD